MSGQLDVTSFLRLCVVRTSPSAFVIIVLVCYVIFLSWVKITLQVKIYEWHRKRQTKEKNTASSGWLPSIQRHCYYIAACATTRVVRSIFPLWMECNLPSALWRQAMVMAQSALTSARANDRLWQRNGCRAFHHNPYSARIDPPAYFHSVMDGIVPPSPLLVQIITNQYALKAPHQNIILTHDLFPPMLFSPSHVL